MSTYGGSQYQIPNISSYLPPSGTVQSGLGTSYTGANQLYNLAQPGSALSLQNQLPSYQSIANQGANFLNATTPQSVAGAQQAYQTATSAADKSGWQLPSLYNLGNLTAAQAQPNYNEAAALKGTQNQLYTMAGGQLASDQGVLNSQMAQLPGLQGYANQALQTGFDPQNALFNRTAQQMQDVLGASNQAAGLGSSPYGANLQSQGMENFLIDWQNQQLQRQQTGAATAGSLYNTMAGLPSAAQGMYNISQGLYNMGQGVGQTGLAYGQAGLNAAQGASSLDQNALNFGSNLASLLNTGAMYPVNMANALASSQFGMQDALAQAQTNMFNQQASGVNAIDQYLKSATGVLGTDISAQQQNLGASQTGLNNALGFASLPLQMMGKG